MDIDELSATLFEQAKRFLEKAKEAKESEVKAPFYNAALLLAFSSLEAHVNAIAEELSIRPKLSVLEQSILKENEYRLKNGRFELTDKLKMYRLEERIDFILSNFSISGLPDKGTWQEQLGTGIKLRNRLVHPKSSVILSEAEVTQCLNAILTCLNHLYSQIFKKPYSTGKNSTDSTLIIDAMDLLYTRKFDGFCLITSDSDFTGLAMRLREEGLSVFGFGEKKTPEAFRNACHKFVFTEVLRNDAASDAPKSEVAPPASAASHSSHANEPPLKFPKKFVLMALDQAIDDSGWAGLGAFGSYLTKLQPDFDSRLYGYKKLSDLVRARTDLFVIEERQVAGSNQKTLYLRAK